MAVVESNCGTNAAAWEKVTIPFASHFRQDGHAVQGFAIRRMTESLQGLKAGLADEGRFRFIGHQANLGALRTVCERAGIPEEQHWHNVSDFGNTGERRGARRVERALGRAAARRPRGDLPRRGGPDLGQSASGRGGTRNDVRRIQEHVRASAWRSSSPLPTGPWWMTPRRVLRPACRRRLF